MFGFTATEYDKKVYNEQLKDFLPDKFIDLHAHLWKKEFEPWGASNGGATWIDRVAEDLTIEDLVQTYKDLFPGKIVIPNIFGGITQNLKQCNDYVLESAKKYQYPHMYRLAYDTPVDIMEQEIIEGGFCGIKPYLSSKPDYIPNSEIRIFDFMPKEQFDVANRLGLVVLLHIPRSARLKDPVNIGELMEIEEKYPNVKLVVAHIGRAYSKEDMGDAFETLKHTKNMMFDFCANTCDYAIEKCLEYVGPDRLLFGSDMPITKMRMYRIVENGEYINVVPRGLYGDVSDDPRMRETDEKDITCFIYEELLAFKRVSQKLGLSKEDVNKIMYKNAERILGL